MIELEGRVVEVFWHSAGAAPARFRLLKARSDIGFVKLGDERAGADYASDLHGGFWVEIDSIQECRVCP